MKGVSGEIPQKGSVPFDFYEPHTKTSLLDDIKLRMELGLIDLVTLSAILALGAWLALVYWQIRLAKRIQIVSRQHHRIPEKVFWLTRARRAIEADESCRSIVRLRNTWAIVFLLLTAFVGSLISYSAWIAS